MRKIDIRFRELNKFNKIQKTFDETSEITSSKLPSTISDKDNKPNFMLAIEYQAFWRSNLLNTQLSKIIPEFW